MNNWWTKIKEYLRRHQWLAVSGFFLILSLIIFHRTLIESGVPGLRHDWFIPVDADGLAQWFNQALYPWVDARGGYPMSYWSDIILRLTVGSLSLIGLSGEIFAKTLLILVVVTSGTASFLLIKKIAAASFWPALAGALVYTLNPLTFNKIIAGHTYYIIAYALAPIFLLLIYQLTDPVNRPFKTWHGRQSILLAAFVLALSGVQLQFPILLGIFALVMVLICGRSWRTYLHLLIPFFIINLFLHLPWLTHFIANSLLYNSQTASTPATFSWFVHNSSQLQQVFYLLGGGNDYWSVTLTTVNLLIPWLMAAGIVLVFVLLNTIRSSGRQFGFFVFWLASLLVLCINNLFPHGSWWLLQQSVIFNIFREVYHLAFFVALTFAILVALVLQKYQSFRSVGPVLTIFWLGLSAPFFVGGNLSGNLENFNPDQSYRVSLDEDHRILYLPSLQPLLWQDNQYSGADPEIYYNSATSLSQMGYSGSLNERFATFWQSQLYFNSDTIKNKLTNFLTMFDVSSLIYRADFSSNIAKFTHLFYYPAKNKLINNQTLEKILAPFSQYLIESNNQWRLYQFDPVDKITVPTSCLATGQWSDLNNIFSLDQGFGCDGIIFAKDNPPLDTPADSLITNQNNWVDLLLGHEDNTVLEPGVYAIDSMDSSASWVSAEHVWWYHPQLAGYPQLFAMAASPSTLNIPPSDLPAGNHHLWVEVFHHPEGGEIELVYEDWRQSIDTQSTNQSFVWLDIGEVNFNLNSDLQIINHTGTNAVGQILFVPAGAYQSQLDQIREQLAGMEITALINPAQTAQSCYVGFDLARYSHFYRNFPDLSDYEIKAHHDQVDVTANFTGGATEDEFASLIYPVNFDLTSTPVLTLINQVESETVQFWEVGFEIDENGDQAADTVLWQRLDAGSVIIDIPQFLHDSDYQLSFDEIKVVGLRFQPHKEYGINMSDQIQSNYQFQLQEVRFHAQSNQLVRQQRQADMINLTDLIRHPSQMIGLGENVVFYNDFPDTEQELVKDDNRLVIKSEFTPDEKAIEYAQVVINTEVDLVLHSYFTADLSIQNPDLQFFDLAFGIDSDYDHQIDQNIWVNSITYDQAGTQTVFYDVLNLLQQKTDNYYHPQILTITILPHKTYQITDPVKPVEFTISGVNFYHEDALNQNLKSPLSVWQTDLNLPLTKEYNLYFHINSNHAQTIYGVVNGQNFVLEIPEKTNDWLGVGEFSFTAGDNQLVLVNYANPVTINQIAVSDRRPTPDQSPKITYEKISPAAYRAQVTLEQPGYILLKESYHPAWQLTAVNQTDNTITTVDPIIMNGWQQGYYLSESGTYQLNFEYRLNRLYSYALIAALFVLVIMLANLLIYYILRATKISKY